MLVPAHFLSAAETVVVYGRDLTDAELGLLLAKRQELATSGVQVSGPYEISIGTVMYWSTVDAANQWATLCNSFTPAPTSVVVNNPPQPMPAQTYTPPTE